MKTYLKQFRSTFFLAVFTFLAIHCSAQKALWGVTSKGAYDHGVIFTTDTNGNSFRVMHEFSKTPGQQPGTAALCKTPGGKMYGVTTMGGYWGGGVLYEFNYKTGAYTTRYNFRAAEGHHPQGGVVLASNGKLYGTTLYGGANGWGSIYEYDPLSDSLIIRVHLSQTTGGGTYGAMIQVTDSLLYGLSTYGGANNKGALFSYNFITGSYTPMVHFNGTGNGANPNGSLLQADNGKLYGTTAYGGVDGTGTLFEYDPAVNILATIYSDFNNVSSLMGNGVNPKGTLVQASNGLLYGMTNAGVSVTSGGWLFEYNIATGVFRKRVAFTGNKHPYTGGDPLGGLVEIKGKLYGVTSKGGINDEGVLFAYDIADSSFSKKADLWLLTTGANPMGTLVEGDSGMLYGHTSFGGSGYGSLFEFNSKTEALLIKVKFDDAPNGKYPSSRLIYGPDNLLYGYNGTGVMYTFNPLTRECKTKLIFTGPNGYDPQGPIIVASNGKLYGTTANGGNNIGNGRGVLFEYDFATGFQHIKVRFGSDSATGKNPLGIPIQARNGKLYGATSYGECTLYSYDISSGKHTLLNVFPEDVIPNGQLMQARNGKIYGVTRLGSTNSRGTLFEYDPDTDSLITVIKFNDTNGHNPQDIVQAANGKLYGTTYNGGVNDGGVLYEFDPVTHAFGIKVNFDQLPDGNGYAPMLLQLSSDSMHILGVALGTDPVINTGSIFRYDIANGIYTKTHGFKMIDGTHPLGLTSACIKPAVSAPGVSICGQGAVTLRAETNRGALHWYASTSDSVSIDTGAILTIPFVDSTTIFYVRSLTNDCSSDFIPVMVTVKEMPDTQLVISGSTLSARAIDTFPPAKHFYQWIDCNKHDTVIAGKTGASFTSEAGGSFAMIIRKGGCIDTSSCHTINCVSPLINTHDTSRCGPGRVTLQASATKGSIKWFAGLTDTVAIDTGNTFHPIVLASTVFYLQAFTAGCSSARETAGVTVLSLPDTSVLLMGSTLTVADSSAGNVYQWIDCTKGNIPVPGKTARSFSPDSSGTYAVQITNGLCTATSGCRSVTTNGTGIMESVLQQKGFIAYPNPSRGVFVISSGPVEAVAYCVIDITGKVILKGSLKPGKHEIDLNGYPGGMYILKIEEKVLRLIKTD